MTKKPNHQDVKKTKPSLIFKIYFQKPIFVDFEALKKNTGKNKTTPHLADQENAEPEKTAILRKKWAQPKTNHPARDCQVSGNIFTSFIYFQFLIITESNKMNSIEQEFTKFITKMGEISGLDHSFSEIISTLFLEPEEISLDELARRTGFSLASISNKAKMLEKQGLVARSRKPGSKKVYLYMDKNLVRNIEIAVLKQMEAKTQLAKHTIPQILNIKPKNEADKKKLELIQKYYKQFSAMEKMTEAIKKAVSE